MKYLLIKETVNFWADLIGVHYSVRTEMIKDMPQGMISATVVAESDSYEELMAYLPKAI